MPPRGAVATAAGANAGRHVVARHAVLQAWVLSHAKCGWIPNRVSACQVRMDAQSWAPTFEHSCCHDIPQAFLSNSTTSLVKSLVGGKVNNLTSHCAFVSVFACERANTRLCVCMGVYVCVCTCVCRRCACACMCCIKQGKQWRAPGYRLQNSPPKASRTIPSGRRP